MNSHCYRSYWRVLMLSGPEPEILVGQDKFTELTSNEAIAFCATGQAPTQIKQQVVFKVEGSGGFSFESCVPRSK